MKKYILIIALILGIDVEAFADSVIFLEHNGSMTSFKAENINDALEAASNGDVLYLSEGTYPGFTISKQISIKGVGPLTVIDGDIEINNSDNVKLTGIFIGYLDMHFFKVKSPVSDLRISQCKIIGTSFNAITENSQIDRCNITSGTYSYEGLVVGGTYSETITTDGVNYTYNYPYIKGLTVSNCIVNKYLQIKSVYSNVTLINCYIDAILRENSNPYGITFINSIINSNSANPLFRKYKMINTAVDFNGKTLDDSEIIDCYDVTISDYSLENLTDNNYFGTDKTVIGPYGGNTPYTLVPAVPRVTKSELKVDPKKQELNATLTISPK